MPQMREVEARRRRAVELEGEKARLQAHIARQARLSLVGRGGEKGGGGGFDGLDVDRPPLKGSPR